MNVLSLFDGMSCGQLALKKAGIEVDNYYACEIDKYAIKVTQANFPDTIQLGSVTDVDFSKLKDIDLIIGGSPCQGFSFAGRQLNFDDPRSKLFFELVRAIKECNPKYFMLENVKMKKEYQDVITKQLGVEPIEINSALVSAQNRKRLYWTNIPNVTLPEDKEVTIRDITEDGFNYHAARIVGRRLNNGKRDDYNTSIPRIQVAEINKDALKTNNLSTVRKDNALVFLGGLLKGLRLENGKYYSRNFREGYRIYSIEGKSATLTAHSKGGTGKYSGLYGKCIGDQIFYRNLTSVECERLQTVPDNYTAHVSETQRFKMLGNGWTVDVIAHIFKNIANEN